MRIVFLTPFPGQSGGNRVVAKYATGLQALGHDVTVVSTPQEMPTTKDNIISFVRDGKKQKIFPLSASYVAPTFRHVYAKDSRFIADGDVPECDAIVATWWETAYWLNNLSKKPDRLFYFMQDYGVTGMEMDRLIPTWFMPFKIITIAPWMKRLINSCNTGKDVMVIENGIDDIFMLNGYREAAPPIIFGHAFTKFRTKGSNNVIDAFVQIRQRFDQARLLCFGNDWPFNSNIPGFEFFLSPKSEELLNLYKSCRSWIFASQAEGFGLPILEAFAAGTPVIATPVGIAPDIITHENGVLLNGFGVQEIIAGMNYMIDISNQKWLEMSKNCIAISKKYNWDLPIKAFENAITAPYQ